MKIYEDDKYIIIESYGIEVKLVKTINGDLYDTGYIRIIYETDIKSIQYMISYIHSNYPVITLNFKDDCVKGGIHVCLLRYLTSGNSWYEDNFGKSDIICNSFYEHIEKHLEKKVYWDEFFNIMWVHTLSIPLDEIKELYIKASTWQEFFRPLVERVEFNKEFSDFFNRFVRIYIGLSHQAFEYCIPVRGYLIDKN